MIKHSFNTKHAFWLTILIALLSINGCATVGTSHEADSEKWIGKMSGMAKGKLELFVAQTRGRGEKYSVKGPFTMKLGTTAGGSGSVTIRGRIKGAIENGRLKTKLFGSVDVEGALYRIAGEMTGSISGSAASGAWKIKHLEGMHSGKWVAEKMVK